MFTAKSPPSLALVLALALPYVLAANDSCSESWMFIDIHYRQVDARLDTFSYGLFIGVGTSSQNQSLWPSLTSNETSIASNDFCASSNPPAHCDDSKYTHGHYGADVSSTWQQTPQYSSTDTLSPSHNVNVTYGQDHLNLFTHFFDPSPASKYPLENHPISVLSDAAHQQDVFFNSGSLGLGPDSTVIKQLIDAGRIDRNVVSLFLGTAYPRAGGSQNGSIVIGGYDAGRFTDEPHKYPLAQPSSPDVSALKVHVKQLSLVTEDGSKIPFVTDDGFDGYISTAHYPMELPQNILQPLATALGATPANNDEGTLHTAQSFNGNLTIMLDDGYEITFPSEWISNASNLTPFSASTLNTANSTNPSKPLVFGAAFLHHLYMTIDYDAANFYLADAKMYDNYVQPQPLCANTVPVPMGKPKISKFVQTGMIGAIIGSILGGTALAWVIFFFIRKFLQRRQSTNVVNKMEGGGVAPLKSSLRRRTMFGLARLTGKSKLGKDVTFGDVKRVSISDSDSESSSGKKGKVIVQSSENYEMNEMKPPQDNTNTTPPAETIKQTILHSPPPPSNNNPYHPSPLPLTPYTATTPHTANPLLGTSSSGPNKYTNYNDTDDSDIPSDYRRSNADSDATRSANRLGLKINTFAPPPGKIAAMRAVGPKTKTKRSGKPTPLRMGIGRKESEGVERLSPTGRSFLRRVFPAS